MSTKQNKFKFSSQDMVLTDGSTISMPSLNKNTNYLLLEMDSVKHPAWHHLKNFRELKQRGRLSTFNKKFGFFIENN